MKTTILQLNQTPYENRRKSGEYFKNMIDSQILGKLKRNNNM